MKKITVTGLALLAAGAVIFGAGFIGARGDLSVANGNIGPFKVQVTDGRIHSGFFRTGSADSSSARGIGGGRDKPMTTPPPIPTPTPVLDDGPDTDIQRFAGSDVKEIELNISYADVELCSTDTMYVYVLSEDMDDFVVTLDKNGVLTVESRDMNTVLGLGLLGEAPGLKIALPAERYFELDIENSCGNVSVSGLTLSGVDIDVDMGDISVETLQCKKMKLDAACGAIYADTVTCAGEFAADADLGDITLRNVHTSGILKADSACGAVEVIDSLAEDAELSADMGDISAVNLVCSGNAKLECDCGAIEFTSLSAAGSIEIENSMGSVEGTLAGSFDDYSVESKASLGSNNLPEMLSRNGIQLRVFTDCGSIDISFEKG